MCQALCCGPDQHPPFSFDSVLLLPGPGKRTTAPMGKCLFGVHWLSQRKPWGKDRIFSKAPEAKAGW